MNPVTPVTPRVESVFPRTWVTVVSACVLAAMSTILPPTASSAEDAVSFRIPETFSPPSSYSISGSSVAKEQSSPMIGYWTGGDVQWRRARVRAGNFARKDRTVLTVSSRFGFAVENPDNSGPDRQNRWQAAFQQPLRIEDPSSRSGGIRQGGDRVFGRRIRLRVPMNPCHIVGDPTRLLPDYRDCFGNPPNPGNYLGIVFSRQADKELDSGSWRQQYNAGSTIRIHKPGARPGEKIRVRVQGEITGQSNGSDLQRSALDAKIIIDQVADLRISGPNPHPSPRAAIDKYVDVPVNTDLRWQLSFNMYVSGQEGTTDVSVALTKQEITLELPNVPGTFAAVPPPVKPLTGGAPGTPGKPGVVITPGPVNPGTPLTRPGVGTSIGTPATGVQRPPGAPSTGGPSLSRPPGALVIPRGVEPEREQGETGK